MIHFNWYDFSELTTQQLYDVLALRSQVFIVEQDCVYLDIDGKDQHAVHLLAVQENLLLGYLRLFPPNDKEDRIIFGRLVMEKTARRNGHGKKLMQELLLYCETNYPGISIKCSAQNYLTQFYKQFGFKTYGDVYEEDGIPHVEMRRE
jgi:ElaA protein